MCIEITGSAILIIFAYICDKGRYCTQVQFYKCEMHYYNISRKATTYNCENNPFYGVLLTTLVALPMIGYIIQIWMYLYA